MNQRELNKKRDKKRDNSILYETTENRINCKIECTKIISLPEIASVEYFTNVLFFTQSNIFLITKCIMKSYTKKKFTDIKQFITSTFSKIMNFNPTLKLTCLKNCDSYLYPAFFPNNHEFLKLPNYGPSDYHLDYHAAQNLPLEIIGKYSGKNNKDNDPAWYYQPWNMNLTLSIDPKIVINVNHIGFREQQCIQLFIAKGMFSNSEKGYIGECIEFNIFHYDYIIKQTMNSDNGLIKKKLVSSFIKHLLHSCAGDVKLRRHVIQLVCETLF